MDKFPKRLGEVMMTMMMKITPCQHPSLVTDPSAKTVQPRDPSRIHKVQPETLKQHALSSALSVA